MICIMCKGSFIPECKRCPSDLKMLQWHFSGSFVHTCQEKCDGRRQLQLRLTPPVSPPRPSRPCWSPVHVECTSSAHIHTQYVFLIKSKKRISPCADRINFLQRQFQHNPQRSEWEDTKLSYFSVAQAEVTMEKIMKSTQPGYTNL